MLSNINIISQNAFVYGAKNRLTFTRVFPKKTFREVSTGGNGITVMYGVFFSATSFTMDRIFSRECVRFVCLCLCDIYFFRPQILFARVRGIIQTFEPPLYFFRYMYKEIFARMTHGKRPKTKPMTPLSFFPLFRYGDEENSSKFLAAVQLSNISRSIVVLFDGKLLEVIKITVMAECRGAALILKDCIVHKQYGRGVKK